MVKLNKCIKNDKVETACKKSGRFINASDDFKAELFIRMNILPYIITKDVKDSVKQFETIQNSIVEEVVVPMKISKLNFSVVQIFLCKLMELYVNDTHILTIHELNNYFSSMRKYKHNYIPYIFRNLDSCLRSRKILLEYLNFFFYKEYTSCFMLQYSKLFKFYIVAKVDITGNNKFINGLTAYICEPKQFKDERSLIDIKGKLFELHGPGSLVLVGCPEHQYCKLPNFLCSSISAKGYIRYNNVPDIVNKFTFRLIKPIKKDKIIRCSYGNEFSVPNSFLCEKKSCVFNNL